MLVEEVLHTQVSGQASQDNEFQVRTYSAKHLLSECRSSMSELPLLMLVAVDEMLM
jgi:hypothetical protein